jgi:hypothetical protein
VPANPRNFQYCKQSIDQAINPSIHPSIKARPSPFRHSRFHRGPTPFLYLSLTSWLCRGYRLEKTHPQLRIYSTSSLRCCIELWPPFSDRGEDTGLARAVSGIPTCFASHISSTVFDTVSLLSSSSSSTSNSTSSIFGYPTVEASVYRSSSGSSTYSLHML